MATLQAVVAQQLRDTPALMGVEPDGLGFDKVYTKWLVETGPGAEPDAFTSGGKIKPAIVVWHGEVNPATSVSVPEWTKWDHFLPIYLFHYPSDHGKDVLDRAIIAVENSLCGMWQPVITGGQRPYIHTNPQENHIDDESQFPGNYVVVLRFQVTGIRPAPAR